MEQPQELIYPMKAFNYLINSHQNYSYTLFNFKVRGRGNRCNQRRYKNQPDCWCDYLPLRSDNLQLSSNAVHPNPFISSSYLSFYPSCQQIGDVNMENRLLLLWRTHCSNYSRYEVHNIWSKKETDVLIGRSILRYTSNAKPNW